jgi:putative tryptophan/tyrosine transport system substrate-binding protein
MGPDRLPRPLVCYFSLAARSQSARLHALHKTCSRRGQMRRREFITLLGGAAAWPVAARAQQPNLWRIGLLAPAPPTPAMLSAFRDGLRERGYVEGQNLFIDVRWPQVTFEQNPDIAAELVRSKVDVIVAWTTPSVVAARRATSTIPIVMVSVGDPVGMGFVASLARPGGNITGVSNISTDLASKQVELLVEIVPGMNHVGVLANLKNPSSASQLRETEKAIRALGLQFEVVEASVPDEFDGAFARLSADGVKGVVLIADASLIEHKGRIAKLAQQAGLPTVFQRGENVEAGGLLSYGPNLNGQFREVAPYIDKLLKGAKPADLPVELPTKFELVINLQTAKALGLTVPPTLITRADEVIE